jgi:hypothetical protein
MLQFRGGVGRTVIAASAAALTLTACATAPEPVFTHQGEFGPEQTFSGELGLGFERQSFDECWLDFKAPLSPISGARRRVQP